MTNTEPASETSSTGVLKSVATRSRKRETILLVEDENLVRQMTCEILQNEGYQVLPARSATEAKMIFGRCRQTVHLLLTDVVLPDQNGCDLANDFKSMSPGLKTLFVSGYPENIVMETSDTRGISYLHKPFSTESLVREVGKTLAMDADEIAV